MSSGQFRRAVAELRWPDGADPCARAGERSVLHYWPVLSPYFRDVLLAPHRRTEGDGVSWTWQEPAAARGFSGRELNELRRRLGVAQELLAENLSRATAGSQRPRAGVDELAGAMATVIAELVEREDAEFSRYACRTESGLRLHSWGSGHAALVAYPDETGHESAAVLPSNTGGATDAQRKRRRRIILVLAVIALLVAGGVIFARRRSDDPAAEKIAREEKQAKPREARHDAEAKADGAKIRRQETLSVAPTTPRPAMGNSRNEAAPVSVSAEVKANSVTTGGESTARRVVSVVNPPAAPAKQGGGVTEDGRGAAAGGISATKHEGDAKPESQEARPAAARNEIGEATAEKPSTAETHASETKARSAVEVVRSSEARAAADDSEPSRPRQKQDDAVETRPVGSARSDEMRHEARAVVLHEAARVTFSAWEDRLLVDVILPTFPVAVDESGPREKSLEEIVAEQRALIPAALRERRVRGGLLFHVQDQANVAALRWTGPGMTSLHANNIEWEAGAMGEWELLEADGAPVARVKCDAGSWSVWTRETVRVSAWFVARSEFLWRRAALEGLPPGWSTRDVAGETRVEFDVRGAPARETLALFDRGTGWAIVRRVERTRLDETR